jgi:hypothetical protein
VSGRGADLQIGSLWKSFLELAEPELGTPVAGESACNEVCETLALTPALSPEERENRPPSLVSFCG